jgi:uncharacterized pyridoxal phosphate-containing UPF0001 family protein
VSAQASQQRSAELRERWQSLGQRVEAAARAAGREPGEITVIAVTKTWPASDIAALHALGVHDVGENRAQELAAKLAELGEVGLEAENGTEVGPAGEPGFADGGLHWHFIGQLQRNKAALVGQSCTALHTLDREALIRPLSAAAAQAGHRLDVFVQLSLDGDPQRGGVTEDQVAPLADLVATDPHLRLRGLMAVPPLGADPRPAFAGLRAVSEQLLRNHPEAAALSAGMSNDFEIAVREGATHLRVGTVLMGSRD